MSYTTTRGLFPPPHVFRTRIGDAQYSGKSLTPQSSFTPLRLAIIHSMLRAKAAAGKRKLKHRASPRVLGGKQKPRQEVSRPIGHVPDASDDTVTECTKTR